MNDAISAIDWEIGVGAPTRRYVFFTTFCTEFWTSTSLVDDARVVLTNILGGHPSCNIFAMLFANLEDVIFERELMKIETIYVLSKPVIMSVKLLHFEATSLVWRRPLSTIPQPFGILFEIANTQLDFLLK